MNIFHVVLTAERESRLPLFVGESAYHKAIHRIGRRCGDRLAMFSLLPEHVHLLLLANREAGRRRAQAVQQSLSPLVSTPLAPSYQKRVNGRSHARSLFRYFLDQPKKHDLPPPTELFVGSCLLDLIGARLVPDITLRIEHALPEFRVEMALRQVGLSLASLASTDRATLRSAGIIRLRVPPY